MLGRCHPLDPSTLQPEAVPENMTDQVCNAVQSSGTYDCGDGYLCLDGDYEAFYVSSTCLLADVCDFVCFQVSTLRRFCLRPLCQWCHAVCCLVHDEMIYFAIKLSITNQIKMKHENVNRNIVHCQARCLRQAEAFSMLILAKSLKSDSV